MKKCNVLEQKCFLNVKRCIVLNYMRTCEMDIASAIVARFQRRNSMRINASHARHTI